MAEIGLSGEEVVGNGAQLIPKKMCQKNTDFKTNTGVL